MLNMYKIGKQNNTQNNIDNLIQINNNQVKLLAFGKEDMTHLADEVYKRISSSSTTNEVSYE